MFMDSFRQGWFASLSLADRDDLVAHWERLSQASLRRRFLRPMRRADLEAHARVALSPGAETIGWYREGVLRAATDIHLDPRGAEAAFSVEAAYRGQGIGRRLLAHALRRARNRHVPELLIMTTRDNVPMIRLARGAGAVLEHDGAEVTGRIRLAPASPASHLADLVEEEAGAVSDISGRVARMAAAWLPWGPTGGRAT